MDNAYFVNEISELLKEDRDCFLATFNNPMAKSLRINTNKADRKTIEEVVFLKEKTPFDEDTYFIDDEEKLGKNPFHLAGLYYLQEPSATMAVNALQIKEGDWVLDLCAAPGGKSTQILSKLHNTGFLLSNEYENKRAMTLLSNIERWGCDNYLITNAATDRLCGQLQGCFDKVLVDAPCSGASMFKKYPQTIKDYNENTVQSCSRRQAEILDNGYLCLKNNGVLVYSTCTYNTTENEDTVLSFLQRHPNMELVDSSLTCGQKGFDEKGYTRRVFPYQKGEGHFCARMIKHKETAMQKLKTRPFSKNPQVERFIEEYCDNALNYTIVNDKVYVTKTPMIDLGCNIIRQGILMGEIIKNRFEPAHHFFVSVMMKEHFKNVCNLDEKQIQTYLSGNVLDIAGFKGYVQICYRHQPIGFGKGDGVQIKNKYPKGLRI